jgi:hypothetical protein
MITLEQRLIPHPEVVDTELQTQETVLLHLTRKRYYSLNLTGTRIWHGMKHGRSLREISQRLQEEFAVDAAHAERSVLRVCVELIQQELVLERE